MSNEQETTAALIARLHEELSQTRANLKSSDETKEFYHQSVKLAISERDAHFAATSKAQDERDQARAELEASKADRDRYAKAARSADAQHADGLNRVDALKIDRTAERLRAESAEHKVAMLEGELSGALATAKTLYADKNKWAGLCSDRERERDQARADFATVDRMLVERTREREEARADCNHNRDLLGQELARGRVLENERDEALQSLGRVQADYQVLLLGTAHGAKCWMDECGWHCGDGCKAENARKCVAAMERDEARERGRAEVLRDVADVMRWNEWPGQPGWESLRNAADLVAGVIPQRWQDALNEAREQLAKLEWAGQMRTGSLGPGNPFMARCCPGCEQIPSNEWTRKAFAADQIGHHPTCWFAKKEAAGKIRNHRKECPARTAEDVAWVDSRWQVNGCKTAPIEGPRPKPIGCDGCKCEKPRALREQWKVKRAHYDHWAEAFSYMLLGVDWAGGGSVTVATDRPVRPGASFVYDQPSRIWKLVDKQPARCSLCLQPDLTGKPHPHARCKEHDDSAKDPARPEPRFKVGERVIVEDKSATVAWVTEGEVQVQFDGVRTLRTFKIPAPKFAVGEWVTLTSYAFEVKRRFWSPNLSRWGYGGDGDATFAEHELTAQTPQHKHDCRESAFLGRMGKWDLWFSTKGSNFVPGPTVFANGGSDPLSEYKECSADKPARYIREPVSEPELIEARRRAVARGLVKP